MSLTLLTAIITEAIQNGPQVIAEIESLFSTGTPTLADLQALRAKIEAENYATFVPASVLPPASDPATAQNP
jgi:hypothetical protein